MVTASINVLWLLPAPSVKLRGAPTTIAVFISIELSVFVASGAACCDHFLNQRVEVREV